MTNPNRIKRPQQNVQEDYYQCYISLPIILLAFVLLLGIGGYIFFLHFSIPHVVIGFFIFIILLLFYRVELYYDGDTVYLRYGIGLVERCVSVNEIEGLDIVSNRYFSTWLYVPSSKLVLKIYIRGGGAVLIPTDEPKRCSEMIDTKHISR